MNNEVAHFFWHGELKKFEHDCILSFIKAGFDVNVWSYTNIKVEGATSRDASEILDESLVYKIYHHFNERTPEHSSLAAFSDLFRYKLLSEYEGWWFDTDCICLRSSNDFKHLRNVKELIIGLEDINRLTSNAIIYSTKEVALQLYRKAESLLIGKEYKLSCWGEIGPQFISQFALDNNMFDNILPKNKFYAISNDQHKMFIENNINYTKQILKNSYVTHVWTSRWKEFGVDKNNLPLNCVVSYLLSQDITNNIVEEEPESIAQFNRLKQINNIYYKFLKRPSDFEGLVSYYKNNMTIDEIIHDVLNSSEAKSLLNN